MGGKQSENKASWKDKLDWKVKSGGEVLKLLLVFEVPCILLTVLFGLLHITLVMVGFMMASVFLPVCLFIFSFTIDRDKMLGNPITTTHKDVFRMSGIIVGFCFVIALVSPLFSSCSSSGSSHSSHDLQNQREAYQIGQALNGLK